MPEDSTIDTELKQSAEKLGLHTEIYDQYYSVGLCKSSTYKTYDNVKEFVTEQSHSLYTYIAKASLNVVLSIGAILIAIYCKDFIKNTYFNHNINITQGDNNTANITNHLVISNLKEATNQNSPINSFSNSSKEANTEIFVAIATLATVGMTTYCIYKWRNLIQAERNNNGQRGL